MSAPRDAGAALHRLPLPGEYGAMSTADADAFARKLVKQAAASGTWLLLPEHLAALKAATANPGAPA